MKGLSYKDKMKAVYFLYRKDGRGTVADTGGLRLSDGCFLVPHSKSNEILEKLSALDVDTRKLEIYASEDQIKQQPLNSKPAR